MPKGIRTSRMNLSSTGIQRYFSISVTYTDVSQSLRLNVQLKYEVIANKLINLHAIALFYTNEKTTKTQTRSFYKVWESNPRPCKYSKRLFIWVFHFRAFIHVGVPNTRHGPNNFSKPPRAINIIKVN